MLRGALLARGITVQRYRVIDSLRRVDPVSLSDERSQSIGDSIQYPDLTACGKVYKYCSAF